MKSITTECTDKQCERQSRAETIVQAREVTDCCRSARCNVNDLADFAGAGRVPVSLALVATAAAVTSVVVFLR